MTAVFVVGEDELCCVLAEAILAHVGLPFEVKQRLVSGGESKFRQKIPAMNNVAENVMPVLMVADADQAACVVEQRDLWLPRHPSERLAMRLAVREAEAWVLADHVGLSHFANVSKDVFPAQPEDEIDPKQTLLGIIKRCKRRELRDEMLPMKGATSPVGLGYNIHMSDFVRTCWSAERAARRAPSLARAIPRVESLLTP
ncbi:hypothetical protein PCA20602_01548 [Pandoraea capi]|uniref:DUF4276 family protein n=1 Tax=Pandoraea capi TaxID=2508286 RepID=A0ABY6VU97_9BURK|nr:hypothetical protein [Pandoraea capi]VVD89531.1 hypothetical protein PCA20602_01548 [Pandoraea capi]